MLRKTIVSLTFTFIVFTTHAQFFRGIGIFAGGTMSSHHYVNSLATDSFFSHTPHLLPRIALQKDLAGVQAL